DRALAENIVAGVVKNLLLLQHLTQLYSGRSLKTIDASVQKIIAIALYQLRFLTRIPASAAVDEAVDQTHRFGFKSAGGFVNAVLRNATRDANPPLPAEQDDPREFARVVLSHPTEVFDRLTAHLGVTEALRICRHDQTEAPTIVRLFPGVTLDQLARPGVTLSPHNEPGLVVVEPAKLLLLSAWAEAGLAQAQDPTSAAVVPALDIQPGQTVLDRCCGRGTKTIQLHAFVGASGRVVAIDPAEDRIASLRATLEQRGIENIDAIRAGMLRELGATIPTQFDRILVDAPCSNSGVLARRGEARYRQTTASLTSVGKLQSAILDDCTGALAPGGRLAYATCSIWPEENEAIVAAFVKRHPEYTISSQRSTLPQSDDDPTHYHDGGYVAILERRSDVP
ncbi:MAG: methyltransferase domain-containing protein, partial [Chthoniobacterales bacterium]|nr:methyltransferase domain-containing protein [Chthoniobacterales bacterium]